MNISCSKFLHSLLKQTIGTIYILEDNWNFEQTDEIDRTFFEYRIKTAKKPFNKTTIEKLTIIFTYLFQLKVVKNKFNEMEAVYAANELIKLIDQSFEVNFTELNNVLESDNTAMRESLIRILNLIFSIMKDKIEVPIDEIKKQLIYFKDHELIKREAQIINNFPKYITDTPYESTEYFIGRDDLINKVLGLIKNEESCMLYGIGGIGKTEIAKAVVKHIVDTPSNEHQIYYVAWIQYEENDLKESLINSFNETKNMNDREEAWNKVLELIHIYRKELLLIIDNIEDDKDAYLLKSISDLPCRILITSRITGFSTLRIIDINELSETDCKKIFYNYYTGFQDDISLLEIISLAERHTVTIELLAKIAETEETNLKDFLKELIDVGFYISDEEASSAHERLKKEGRIIEQLKKLFKVYGFPLDQEKLLMQISTIPALQFNFKKAKEWFSLKNRTSLKHLTKKGWIKTTSHVEDGIKISIYWIHSVIASAIRSQYETILYDTCQSFIHQLTKEMWYDRTIENGSIKKYLIQFSWSLNDVFGERLNSQDDVEFLKSMASIYYDIANYSKAEQIYKRILNIYHNMHDPDILQMSAVHASLAMTYQEVGYFDEAMLEFKTSYALLEQGNLLENANAGSLYNDIGLLHLARYELKEAKAYFEKAYAILKNHYGEDNTRVALVLYNIIITHSKMGNVDEAIEMLQNGLGNVKKVFGADNLHISDYFNMLGSLYETTGRYPEALEYYIKSKTIRIEKLGKMHPLSIDVENSIALIYTSYEKYDEALEIFRDILKANISIYGENNSSVAVIYNNIGLIYFYKEDYSSALIEYQKSISSYLKYYGKDNPETGVVYNNIGYALTEQGNPNKALEYHHKALEIFISKYGKNHQDIAHTYNDLSVAYMQLEDKKTAYEYLGQAIEIYKEIFGENTPLLASPYNNLALLLESDENYENSLTCFQYARQLYLSNHDVQNSDALSSIDESIQRVLNIIEMKI